jgi:hypothetical protein
MVRGEKNEIYRKLINKFNELMKNGKQNIPVTWKDEIRAALWVLEDEKAFTQGTGFMLKDYGLITCNHVISENTVAYQWHKPFKKYNISILKRNKDLDLAILKIDKKENDYFELFIGNSETVMHDSELILAGCPRFSAGAEPLIKKTYCLNFRNRMGKRHMLLGDWIIEGNSGGPVLNTENEVIGVAASGAETTALIDKEIEFGVIPINFLDSF